MPGVIKPQSIQNYDKRSCACGCQRNPGKSR
ncbi:MAG TPA: hypothetical protein DCQ37_23240 [Desulfobacteraceae bacterium]|nr:hypothetical protein [Desulfobacteraceae bacterium]